jgi:thiol-disulfide isomerase/thioredoxin
MDPAIQEKFNVQMCRSLLERRVEVEPQVEGSPTVPLYKDFKVMDRNGEPVKLSDVIRNGGKRYVLVDFWATWCRPCCDQFPKLKEIYASYHDKGLEVFAVSYDMDKAKWISYIKENNLEWLHGIPASDTVLNSISREYVISGIPTNILIDCQTGVIIGRDMPMEVLESKLEELVESKN